MKILLDSCVWGGAGAPLRAAGHDVVWAGEWPEDPGDEELLARAFSEQRILVTLDKDFGELAILRGTPHCGILRIVNFPARRQADVCLAVVTAHGTELLAGAIVTAEPGRMRIRPPESFPAETQTQPIAAAAAKLSDDDLLSQRNWQRAVIEGIEELPPDIRVSVGYSPPTVRMVIVTVSVEPIDEGETDVARVEVTWWDSMRDKGWLAEQEHLYGPGGELMEQAEWPVISLFGPATNFEQGFFPDRATVGSFQESIQLAILQEMWGGGGISMISKDAKGRFIRDDGSPILAWQFPPKGKRRRRKRE